MILICLTNWFQSTLKSTQHKVGRSMLHEWSKVPYIYPSSLDLIRHLKIISYSPIHAYVAVVQSLTLPSDQWQYFSFQL